MKGESCADCAFWKLRNAKGSQVGGTEDELHDRDWGVCRVRAPSVVLELLGEWHSSAETHWPDTAGDDFCGELELPSELPELGELAQLGAYELAELLHGTAVELRSRTAELAGGVLDASKLEELGRFVWDGASSLVLYQDGDTLRAGAAAAGLGILELEL